MNNFVDVINVRTMYSPQEVEEGFLVGQIAYEAEQRITNYILEGTGVTEAEFMTIEALDDAISLGRPPRTRFCRIFTSQDQINKAKDNWDRLDAILNCDSSFYRAITAFKSYRRVGGRDLQDTDELYHRVRGFRHTDEQDKNITLRILTALSMLPA